MIMIIIILLSTLLSTLLLYLSLLLLLLCDDDDDDDSEYKPKHGLVEYNMGLIWIFFISVINKQGCHSHKIRPFTKKL
jgi:hypothetical protein